MRVLNSGEALYKRKEAAEYLDVSETTLANWACTKKFHIPYYKIGKSVRYKKSDLEKFVNDGKIANVNHGGGR